MKDFLRSVPEEVTGNALYDMLIKHVLATLWAWLILKLWARQTTTVSRSIELRWHVQKRLWWRKLLGE